MTRILLSLAALLLTLATTAQNKEQNQEQDYKALCQQALHNAPFQTGTADFTPSQRAIIQHSQASRKVVKRVDSNTEDEEFIFDPAGEEKMYVMSLYSYDKSNSKFVRAQSLKSQVRYASDGKTVYFKDLTKSLGVLTWLKGEKKTMTKDSLAVGIRKGDEVINIPFGQSLVYYQGKYLVFFAPMTYDDATGNTEVQDNFTLIVRGDSLVQPTLPEGKFQAAAGYVIISETKQGTLSLDIDHNMRLENKPFIQVPSTAEPVTYVYSFINSSGNIYKKKANVIRQGSDLYMQLSTSAPDAYIKGTIVGNEIEIESPQIITDSTFIYYYSLNDAVYENGELTDFTPTSARRLKWDETTQSISPLPASGQKNEDVISADYLDGMSVCRDYVMAPTLNVYGGDVPRKPASPIFRSVNLSSEMVGSFTFNYMSFVVPALDVDSNYINKDLITYRIFINGEPYTFKPEIYKNLKSEMTEVSVNFADGADFYTYDQLHYVYLYLGQNDVSSLGIQSIYTVDGQPTYSDIVTEYFDGGGEEEDKRSDYDLSLTSCRMKDVMTKQGDTPILLCDIYNAGKKEVNSFNIIYKIAGKTNTLKSDKTVTPGNSSYFEVPLDVSPAAIGISVPVEVSIVLTDGMTDANEANNASTTAYAIYDETFAPNTVLLEEFTSEGCGWCPYGAFRIHTALEESQLKDNIIWMCHHEGFGTDWLTAEASTEYLPLYGGNSFAPAMMVNRDQKYSDEQYPVYSISAETEDIISTFKTALQAPSFVKVNATADTEGSKLNTHIEMEKNALFDLQCPKARLTVFLVEDSIASKKQKSYSGHTIPYHHNALRTVLTPVWGEEIVWNGTKAAYDFQYEIPADYVTEHLSVIAFVHEMNENDVNQRRIYNTAQAVLGKTDGIQPTRENARLNEPSFNLNGQRVNASYRGIRIMNGKKILK